MVDIPTQFTFEHLMSHTFPGFFSAVTLFMLIDVWSPLDLTSLAIDGITGLGTFIGFVLLIGSILGIIIDGVYHSVIADNIFDQFEGVKSYKGEIKTRCFKAGCFEGSPEGDEEKLSHQELSHHYFIKQMGEEKAITIFQNIINSYYCYARFYSNTFIALVPFSIIVPFYLFDIFQISWGLCVFIGIIAFLSACFCLNSGYVAYWMYNRALFSAIFGYINTKNDTTKPKKGESAGKCCKIEVIIEGDE